jgi:hypothetical protein
MKSTISQYMSVPSAIRDVIGFLVMFGFALVVMVVTAVGTVLYGHDAHTWLYESPFDSARWKAARGAGPGDKRRYGMVDDVLRNKQQFVGLSAAQVRDVFGEPTQEGNGLDDRDLLYSLGSRGWSLEWLAVDIGDDGCVEDLHIESD